MDGAALTGQLIAGRDLRFEVATTAHDAALRHLLRGNPMAGQISLSLEREPSYFAAAAIEGSEHQTIVAVKGDHVICAGSISSRLRFINGKPIRVGYLGGLRLDATYRGQSSIIRRGYEMFRQLHEQGGPAIYLTSIVADNLPARRLLERGLKRMPAYRFMGELVTLVIRRSSLRNCSRREREATDAELSELLNRANQQYQFAPVWTSEELREAEFVEARSPDGQVMACAALWDQWAIKQTIVRGYAAPLRWSRPVLNLTASLLGRPRLPSLGKPLSHAFVSHLAVDLNGLDVLDDLIGRIQELAKARQIDYLTLGLDARDPRMTHLRKAYRPREYVSRLYAVHWEDGETLAQSLDDRLLAPEIAIL